MRLRWGGDRRAVVTRLAGAALLVTTWLALAPTAIGGATTLVMVDGHSMEPMLYTGDLAVAMRRPSYSVGDLVVITVGGGLVIHRLVHENADGTWRTQGDNKPGPDPWRVASSQIKGRYLLGIPGLGHGLRWLQQEPLVIGGVAGLFTLLLFSGRRGRHSHERSRPPDRIDHWTIVVMCLLGGVYCLLLSTVFVGGGYALLSALPLTLGLGGLMSTGLGVLMLTDLLQDSIAPE